MEKVKGFSFAIAKPGVRPSSAIEAGITLTPTLNKFELNGLATKLMGLETGDSVTIICDDEATTVDEKFFICKGINGNSAKLASHEQEEGQGKQLSFTYAGIYSKILLSVLNNSVEQVDVPKERLRFLGLAKSNTCLKKVYGKITIGPKVEINNEEVQLYSINGWMTSDHKPKKNYEKE